MSDHQTAFEAAVAASASKIMYTGGAASGAGFVLSNELIGAIGLVIALAGFVVNWYYRRKDDRRRQHEHDAKMAQLGMYEQG